MRFEGAQTNLRFIYGFLERSGLLVEFLLGSLRCFTTLTGDVVKASVHFFDNGVDAVAERLPDTLPY